MRKTTPHIARRLLSIALALFALTALAATAGNAALGGGTASAAATASSGKSTKALFWGAQIGTQLTGRKPPFDMSALTEFEQNTRKPVSLLAFDSPFADCTKKPCEFYGFPAVPFQEIRERGGIPLLSWSSSSTGQNSKRQPEFQLRKLINGKYDKFIRGFAENAKKWGHPFFLRFDWEMNGFWFPWAEAVNNNRPGEFIQAWRHVHDIFTSVGATNATWVWCPNIALVDNLKDVRKYYPGSKYVDWTGLDGFNWGSSLGPKGWMTFKQIFSSTYAEIMKFAADKPMLIGETAADERGGSKPNWIKETLNIIPREFKRIRGLIWFDENDQGQEWPIESSKASTHAFAKAISSRLYRPNLYAHLAKGKIAAPTLAPPPTEAPASEAIPLSP